MSGGGSGTFRQELPPPGGYKRIPFERIEARKLIKSRGIIAVYLTCTFGGCYLWYLNALKTLRLQTESRGARIALNPMIQAERDRTYLTQLRKNRDEEEKLMANVPGWIVGRYYGEKIYNTLAPDQWHDVVPNEYFAHSDPWYLHHHTEFHKWM